MAMPHSLPCRIGVARVTEQTASFIQILQLLEMKLAVAVILLHRLDARGNVAFALPMCLTISWQGNGRDCCQNPAIRLATPMRLM